VTTEGSGSAWAAGDAGVTSQMGSARDLERVLADLYDHPERLARMSKAAPSRVKFFDVDHWTDELERSLQTVHAHAAG
jgi:hypothetical protein